MTIEITVAVSAICTILSVSLSLANFFRNRKHDDAGEGKSTGTILTELGYIKSSVEDIKRKQETQDTRHTEIMIRIAEIDASAKQAHKRIDTIEGRTEH